MGNNMTPCVLIDLRKLLYNTDIRVKIFKHVKDLSPNTMYFLNDYGIILNKYGRFSLFQEQIRELLAAGISNIMNIIKSTYYK